jgi:ethanolaminephosphotransferase
MLPTLGVEKYSLIPTSLYEMPFNEVIMAYGGVVLIFNTITSAMNVLSSRKDAAEHTRSSISPLWGLLPAFWTWTLTGAYLYLQPVILHAHLVPFVFYVGLINAYSVGKIITAHLTKQPSFPYTNSLIIPLGLAVADSVGPHLGLWPSVLGDGVYQIAFMFACLGLGVGVYGSFVYDIITTICDYLDIWCLTIKHPKDGQVAGGGKKAN